MVPDGDEEDEVYPWEVTNDPELPDWLPEYDCDEPGTPNFNAADMTPMDLFGKVFPDELITDIATETNRYAAQYIEGHPHVSFTDVSLEDMKTFLGIFIFVGVYHNGPLKDLWTTDTLLQRPGFRDVMSKDRFMSILRFLHLVDNSVVRPVYGEPDYDRLYKVRSFVERIVSSWRECWNQEKNTAVDEAMVAFKGRTSILQYMKSKPTKWGMKAWVLAGSKTGYVTEWKIYEGKEDQAQGIGYGVVTKCSEHCEPGQCIYCNNFFTSHKLLSDLKLRGIGGCGTVRANRVDNPKELNIFKKGTRKAILEEKSPVFMKNKDSGCLAVGWFDKRPVTLLSTISGAGTTEKRVRQRGPEQFRTIQKPDAIEQYNQNMGGVDKSDQLNSYFQIANRSLKWWKKVFFHLLVSACTNAYIIHKVSNDRPMTDREFRMALVHELMGQYQHGRIGVAARRPQGVAGLPDQRLNMQPHFLQNVAPGKRPDCIVCCIKKQKGEGPGYVHRSQVSTCCKNCTGFPPLHPIPCFEIFHTRKDPRDYWRRNYWNV